VTAGVELLAALALTVLLAWAITGMVRRHALNNAILDIPNSRSSHLVPTPRGGGLAIVVTFLPCVAALYFLRMLDLPIAAALGLGGGSIAVVGYLDDRKALSATIRFAVHMGASIGVVILLGGLAGSSLRAIGLQGIFAGSVIAVLSLGWMTNLFNFMDGIDGIAASETVFIATAGAWLSWRAGADLGLAIAMLALSGATVGFLIWNWPPARIFMGDVGSGFLGFILAALGLAASRSGVTPIEVWVILGGVFLVDSSATLLRRIVRGDRWLEAHRTHAYQHLARRWHGHLPVTAVILAVNVLWLLPLAWLAATFREQAWWFVSAALIPLAALAIVIGAGRREG
jgi:Fuc2NAc and GlcNAc transferase